MSMRLDKFLKVSRLIKRRTLAKEVADKGRITINGQQAKASSNVKDGDELTVRFGQKLVTVRVDKIQETTKKMRQQKCIRSLRKKSWQRSKDKLGSISFLRTYTCTKSVVL